MPFPSKPPNPPRHKTEHSPINFSKDYNSNINIHTNSNYISQLEDQLSAQSKNISKLQKYKTLCEEFIKKMNPYQPLPITEYMLSNNYEIIKDPINAAEQQNYADLLKKTIENELIKNGLLNHNINAEGVIDLAKIRLECEEYKKQLVLAQSMISSLKNDLIELTRENEDLKMNHEKNINSINNNESINMNNQIFDINKKLINYKNNYEKISNDFEKLLNEKKSIKNENTILKKEIKQMKSKINELENNKNKIEKISIKEEKINDIDYKRKFEEIREKLNNIEKEKNNLNDDEINNYKKIKEENDKLIIENKKQKEDIQNIIKEKIIIENENKENKNKLNELNKIYEKEKEKLNEELKKLNEKYLEKENEKENYNYYIDDTEDENNFFEKKKDSTLLLNINENKENKDEKYNELNNKYNYLLNIYNNILKEKEKIKEIFIKRNKLNINDNNSNKLELKKLIENSIEFKGINNNINDSFDFNKINYILWEMDDEIKEKDKIINDYKIQRDELGNEVEEKFKYYDEYITNNKINIKNLLSQLFNLLVQFKEKMNLLSKNNNNYLSQYISPNFISYIDKIINQINAINNISNYDIELNDNIFFDTINTFISLLCQELSIIYNKNYNYKKYNFNNKNEEIKNDNDDLFSKINYINNERKEIMKDYTDLKMKFQLILKENSKMKNDIIDLDNKLKEMTLKYNCNQKTVLVNNEGKKILLNNIYKFIKIISDKELAKIMYDILNLIDQINITQLNKCLVEEKLNLMESNENIIDNEENELGIYLSNERNKLKKLIDDYDNKIIDKNRMLQKLNEEYNNKEIIYLNNIKELSEKNEFLINNNEELRKKLIDMERENYKFEDNSTLNKETYQNSASKIYNKTFELLEKNKKINAFEMDYRNTNNNK